MRRWALEFSSRLGPGDVVALSGPLGAGKTTLSQGLLRGVGVKEPVTSPTYSLIQTYEGRLLVHHMDLYRLSGPEEFELIGGFEILGGSGLCVIEWAERLRDQLPYGTWLVKLELLSRGRRVSVTRTRENGVEKEAT